MADPVTAEQPSKPTPEPIVSGAQTRKEKRKSLKKLKRQRIRREAAIREREEEEARANDPEEQLRIKLKEQEEAEVSERARKEFEERERLWLEAAAKRKAEEEERKQQRLLEESEIRKNRQGEHGNELEEYDEWDYVEDGPPEIICQGNEIIIKKKRVKVAKNSADRKPDDQDADRPTSNPLPPQSVAFASYNSEKAVSAQELLEGVAQQVPNFGTEQDKAHCPFHLKTGACRFGTRCSRAHFYPDKSCTLLIKNMYNGPGLVWEQDEVLEYTDEEVDRCYEDFYEDVHTEFLKFGELVNFKVCKNGAYHLRGNVYVHYKLLESAILAYNTMNGRYFAGKQITCEFVGVTRWKVAICGEYMKTRLRTCSHGTACNFIHCFRNPGGDYEWADWDKPPPKYWIRKMAVLFGHSDESSYGKQMEHDNFEGPWDSSRKRTPINGRRYHSRSPRDAVEVHVSKRDPHSSRAATRERSRRRNETSSLHESEHYERKHKSETHDYDINNHSHGHASSDSRSKEKDTESQNNYRKNEAHQREKNNHSTKQERSSRRKREDLSDKQERSETKHRSKSSKRRREENVLSDHPSDSSEGKRNRSSSRSSEEYYYRHSIDADDRYNGKRRKVIKQEVNDDRYTSTEFPDRWEATEEISDCEETHEKPKRHRGKRKHESFDKSDSDEALDGRAHRKHSRSQTHTRRSSSSEKRTQGRSHKS